MGWDAVFDVICYLYCTRGNPLDEFAGKDNLTFIFTWNVNVHGLTMSERHRITGLHRIRSRWHDRQRHPLQDLMRECRYRIATDPRDKIYSLLGLMDDHMNDLLQPDYSKSVGNVSFHSI